MFWKLLLAPRKLNRWIYSSQIAATPSMSVLAPQERKKTQVFLSTILILWIYDFMKSDLEAK